MARKRVPCLSFFPQPIPAPSSLSLSLPLLLLFSLSLSFSVHTHMHAHTHLGREGSGVLSANPRARQKGRNVIHKRLKIKSRVLTTNADMYQPGVEEAGLGDSRKSEEDVAVRARWSEGEPQKAAQSDSSMASIASTEFSQSHEESSSEASRGEEDEQENEKEQDSGRGAATAGTQVREARLQQDQMKLSGTRVPQSLPPATSATSLRNATRSQNSSARRRPNGVASGDCMGLSSKGVGGGGLESHMASYESDRSTPPWRKMVSSLEDDERERSAMPACASIGPDDGIHRALDAAVGDGVPRVAREPVTCEWIDPTAITGEGPDKMRASASSAKEREGAGSTEAAGRGKGGSWNFWASWNNRHTVDKHGTSVISGAQEGRMTAVVADSNSKGWWRRWVGAGRSTLREGFGEDGMEAGSRQDAVGWRWSSVVGSVAGMAKTVVSGIEGNETVAGDSKGKSHGQDEFGRVDVAMQIDTRLPSAGESLTVGVGTGGADEGMRLKTWDAGEGSGEGMGLPAQKPVVIPADVGSGGSGEGESKRGALLVGHAGVRVLPVAGAEGVRRQVPVTSRSRWFFGKSEQGAKQTQVRERAPERECVLEEGVPGTPPGSRILRIMRDQRCAGYGSQSGERKIVANLRRGGGSSVAGWRKWIPTAKTGLAHMMASGGVKKKPVGMGAGAPWRRGVRDDDVPAWRRPVSH